MEMLENPEVTKELMGGLVRLATVVIGLPSLFCFLSYLAYVTMKAHADNNEDLDDDSVGIEGEKW